MAISINSLMKKTPLRRGGLVRAMGGVSPAFTAQPAQPVIQPQPMGLPEKYGFNELADYESNLRNQFGQRAKSEILNTRNALATSLNDQGKKFFEMNNPYILEDLNARGVFTSPTAVNTAQANALKEIELANQGRLSEFDTAATSAQLQAEQDALDSALDLRRGELEQRFQTDQSAREEQMARDLAKQSGRNAITGSLIGAGGGVLGGLLAGGGGLGGLFGGGAGAAGAAGAGGAAGGAGALGGLGAALPLGALAIGGTLGYKALPDKAKAVIAPLVNPIKTVKTVTKSVSKAVKKAFCFDGETLVAMADGSASPISKLYVGAETKGGPVESLRVSKTDDGTRYSYKEIDVTGSHAVLEDGQWIRVEDSIYAMPMSGEGIVWSLVTPTHRIFVNGITFADEHENDGYETLTIEQSLDELNRQQLESTTDGIREVSRAG